MRFATLAPALILLALVFGCNGGGDPQSQAIAPDSAGEEGLVSGEQDPALESKNGSGCIPDDPANDELTEDFLSLYLIMGAIDFEEIIGDLYLSDYANLRTWGWYSRVRMAERDDRPFLRLQALRELGVFGEWYAFGRQHNELTLSHYVFFSSTECATAYFESEIGGEELGVNGAISDYAIEKKFSFNEAALLMRDTLTGGLVIHLTIGGESDQTERLLRNVEELALAYLMQTTSIKVD